MDSAAADWAVYQSFLLPSLECSAGIAGRQYIGHMGGLRAGGRIACYWIHGALRLGKNPGAWHSRSFGIDPDQWEPCRAQAGYSETPIVGDLDRERRTLRRRRADHHDRRCVWI